MDDVRGMSLHIGLNRVDPDGYNGWSGDLAGCENDARDMRA
ncbi:MAG: caspase family protein, partial [Actinomycetota bacterium]|nr:caspase family protein [Actinomycetota bacterium]